MMFEDLGLENRPSKSRTRPRLRGADPHPGAGHPLALEGRDRARLRPDRHGQDRRFILPTLQRIAQAYGKPIRRSAVAACGRPSAARSPRGDPHPGARRPNRGSGPSLCQVYRAIGRRGSTAAWATTPSSGKLRRGVDVLVPHRPLLDCSQRGE